MEKTPLLRTYTDRKFGRTSASLNEEDAIAVNTSSVTSAKRKLEDAEIDDGENGGSGKQVKRRFSYSAAE